MGLLSALFLFLFRFLFLFLFLFRLVGAFCFPVSPSLLVFSCSVFGGFGLFCSVFFGGLFGFASVLLFCLFLGQNLRIPQ